MRYILSRNEGYPCILDDLVDTAIFVVEAAYVATHIDEIKERKEKEEHKYDHLSDIERSISMSLDNNLKRFKRATER
jgi:hypothetical protein